MIPWRLKIEKMGKISAQWRRGWISFVHAGVVNTFSVTGSFRPNRKVEASINFCRSCGRM